MIWSVLQARAFYEKELQILKHVYGEVHPDIAVAYNNIALIELKRGNITVCLLWVLELRVVMTGQYENTELLLSAAIKIAKETFGDRHEEFGITTLNLAIAQLTNGDKERAKEGFERALACLSATLGDAHPDTLKAQMGIDMCSWIDLDWERRHRLLPVRSWLFLTETIPIKWRRAERCILSQRSFFSNFRWAFMRGILTITLHGKSKALFCVIESWNTLIT